MDDLLLAQIGELLERADNNAKITISECDRFLNQIPSFSDKHTIEDTRSFLEYLGNPEQNIQIIHVAGPNGKGSVCNYLSSVLTKADYKRLCESWSPDLGLHFDLGIPSEMTVITDETED